MVERTVLLKLDMPYSEEERRREIAAYSLKALARVPSVARVHAAVAADDKTAASWDIVLKIWFESVDQIAAYIMDPGHRAYVDGYLKPKLERLEAWNFQAVPG